MSQRRENPDWQDFENNRCPCGCDGDVENPNARYLPGGFTYDSTENGPQVGTLTVTTWDDRERGFGGIRLDSVVYDGGFLVFEDNNLRSTTVYRVPNVSHYTAALDVAYEPLAPWEIELLNNDGPPF